MVCLFLFFCLMGLLLKRFLLPSMPPTQRESGMTAARGKINETNNVQIGRRELQFKSALGVSCVVLKEAPMS
ncbi:uncharacterized protein [Physcomitrium patens]|uniref:uncharacterized protein n=1 Tax=Physcomitrium patens TaxID=3218 RepID=UPI003CCD9E16